MASGVNVGFNLTAVAGAAAIASISGIANNMNGGQAAADILTALTSPSICYIPIATDSIEEVNEADVAESMVISQLTGSRVYITDNVAPKPKKWVLHGYITELLPILEDFLTIKPTIVVQRAVLQAAYNSRDLVPFKDNFGNVNDVVISSLRIKSIPDAENAMEVEIQLQEVNLLTTTSSGVLSLNSIEKASVFTAAMKSLGSLSMLAATGVAAGTTAVSLL